MAAVLAVSFPALASAQRPTPAQAQELLRTRPDLVEQLRQRLTDSGLTPDQIRARLKAEGYPENLLDAYLPGSTGTPDPRLRDSVATALKSLGLADSLDFTAPGDTTGQLRTPADSLRDSIPILKRKPRTIADSLAYVRALLRQQAQTDSGRTIFGLDLFQADAKQFQPNLAGPVDANYKLGPGDKLVLILTGDVELSYELEVNREGFIIVPQVGQISVANLTLGQLEDVLYTRLARSYSGVRRQNPTTRFAVTVARLRSLQVFVVGDVERPGSYRVSSASTAFNALYAAGGPSKNGTLRRVEIKRAGKTVETFDAYDYLARGDASKDVRLENGDVVFVGAHGPRARILGEITRPATYELKAGETVADLVRFAGGFTALAERRRLTVERIVPPAQRRNPGEDRAVVSVAGENGATTVPINDGDVVRVPAISERVRGRITVKGHVWNPGTIAVTPGITLSQAVRAAGGLPGDTYLGRVLVSRLLPDSTRIQLRSAFTDTLANVTEDIPLREDDEIQVFSLTDFRPRRYVTIAGAVKKGGRFPYHDGMTMRDLILLGGGLEQSAYLNEAEIARLPENRAGGATAVTVRVPLDSTYLFERTAERAYLGPPGLSAPAGGAADVPLKPYDNVLIFRQPDWELQRLVWLTGEVKFPGRYALLKKDEKLADLVQRAGGLTAEAYPEGIVFLRQRDSVGRVALDLRQAMRDREEIDNVTLVDGDSVSIPRYNGVVQVKGFVNSTSAVAVRPGNDILFYVRSAGGATRKGDDRRAYVIQPNGLVETIRPWPWFLSFLPSRKPTPRGGSTVVVPERDTTEGQAAQAALAQVLTFIGVLSPVIAVIVSKRL